MALGLFAGIPVAGYAEALPWYEHRPALATVVPDGTVIAGDAGQRRRKVASQK